MLTRRHRPGDDDAAGHAEREESEMVRSMGGVIAGLVVMLIVVGSTMTPREHAGQGVAAGASPFR